MPEIIPLPRILTADRTLYGVGRYDGLLALGEREC